MNGISAFLTVGSGMNLLYVMILLPFVLALLCLAIPKQSYAAKAGVFVLAVVANLIFAFGVFRAPDATMLIPWAGFEINLALRIYDFSRFIVIAAAIIVFLVGLYSVSFLRRKEYAGQFFFYYLLTLALANGAFLANNFVVMLFFWEGLLVSLFGMLVLVNKDNVRTAVKAIVLSGTADLLLMLGIAMTCMHAGTMMMDAVNDLSVSGIGAVGFLCMLAGAIGKAGSMPFHSWIPDAANDAPLPFMALLPAALEKMLGIYLLTRIVLDFYDLQPGSTMSLVVMIIGAVTLFFAVSMALIQKDMKRLLSFHAISQVGYMILGIGTALPVGIVGGLFHMVNNALYKCCLFLSAGTIERATGTTDLKRVGGLGKMMPLTGLCFIIAALSIAGVPPFNGFFSKELVFDAAIESHTVFYVIAVVGAFMTAASFLKLGHAAFFGPTKLPDDVKKEDVREAPAAMLLPMVVLAAACVVFGVWNRLPLDMIQPLLGDTLAGQDFAGWPHSMTLVLISLAVLLLAIINHIIGYRMTGEGIKAVDHIHYAPGLRQLYHCAEQHYFDPFDILMVFVRIYAWLCYCIDRAINWIYDVLLVRLTSFFSQSLKNFNTGDVAGYMVRSFIGLAFLVLLFVLLI